MTVATALLTSLDDEDDNADAAEKAPAVVGPAQRHDAGGPSNALVVI
jgi:hypothetical protein